MPQASAFSARLRQNFTKTFRECWYAFNPLTRSRGAWAARARRARASLVEKGWGKRSNSKQALPSKGDVDESAESGAWNDGRRFRYAESKRGTEARLQTQIEKPWEEYSENSTVIHVSMEHRGQWTKWLWRLFFWSNHFRSFLISNVWLICTSPKSFTELQPVDLVEYKFLMFFSQKLKFKNGSWWGILRFWAT
jgi:hypothetical protein